MSKTAEKKTAPRKWEGAIEVPIRHYRIKSCVRCGEEFPPRYPNHRYCSDECRLPVRLCACGCGEKLSRQAKNWGGRWRPGHSAKNGKILVCGRCGGRFYRRRSVLAASKYCSLDCYRLDKPAKVTGRNNSFFGCAHRPAAISRMSVRARLRGNNGNVKRGAENHLWRGGGILDREVAIIGWSELVDH